MVHPEFYSGNFLMGSGVDHKLLLYGHSLQSPDHSLQISQSKGMQGGLRSEIRGSACSSKGLPVPPDS